jgi:hypothetical protein
VSAARRRIISVSVLAVRGSASAMRDPLRSISA